MPPLQEWQLQDAKNRFSELVRRARDEGPQSVSIRGKPAAVVLSADAYAALAQPRLSLAEYLLSGPAWPDDLVELVNNRARDTGRAVHL
jgi:prevent-host-death family protein